MEKEISSQVKIRFSDCDPIGHLNNVKYLEYMLNAREDHVEDFFGFTYEEYSRKTGCTWIAIQNEIAYLKEVRYNSKVTISSKTIRIEDRTAIVEILMKDAQSQFVHSVLWITIIYFNLKTRKSEKHPEDIRSLFQSVLMDIPEKTFAERVLFLRKNNASLSR